MTFPPLTDLLPLRGRALLLERIVEADATRARVVARVPADSPFVVAGAVPAHVALEIAAQAAGAHGRLAPHAGGDHRPPREGYLVVVRDATFETATFAAGRELDVTVELDGEAAPLALYRFSVSGAASGTLGTYVATGN